MLRSRCQGVRSPSSSCHVKVDVTMCIFWWQIPICQKEHLPVTRTHVLMLGVRRHDPMSACSRARSARKDRTWIVSEHAVTHCHQRLKWPAAGLCYKRALHGALLCTLCSFESHCEQVIGPQNRFRPSQAFRSGSQTERARSLRRVTGKKIAEMLSRETQSRFQRQCNMSACSATRFCDI